MPYDSLRPYLEALEKRGLFKWIDREVEKDWEISCVGRMLFRAMPESRRLGLGFRKIKGHPGARVVSGVIAVSEQMVATALECEANATAIHQRMIRGLTHPIDPVVVKTGPCKEVVIDGADVDLTKLPIPVWTPTKDAGPYLTPLWVTKDPDNGRRDIGIRRCQIKGRNKTGILFGAPDRGGAIHHEKWRRLGKPMPAAIFIGGDPVQYIVAPSRYGPDELSIAGGIRGKAVELVKCDTVDLEVPATAEIVIEGEVGTDHTEPEGPFGEFTGYMAGGRHCPVFTVKRITHRKDPIWLGVISQFPPSESSMIKRILLEASLIKHVSEDLNIPGVVDIHALEAGGCTATLWVSLKKMYTGHVDQLVFGILGYFGLSYYKWIIVTDDTVDIRDPFMRDWILAWHVRPDRDLRILPNTPSVELDPSGYPPNETPAEKLGGKIVVDATKKFEFPEVSLPPLQYLKRVADNWKDYGLPPLDELRLPKNI